MYQLQVPRVLLQQSRLAKHAGLNNVLFVRQVCQLGHMFNKITVFRII